MEVLTHGAAAEEYRGLPGSEQDAMDNAITKLRVLGIQLRYPHSSAVKGANQLRELGVDPGEIR